MLLESSGVGEPLAHALQNKTAKVGVVGLGYVGLPLLNAFIKAGFDTIGFDVDTAKVARLLAGESYIKHVPSEWIGSWLAAGQFTATAEMQRLAEADAILNWFNDPARSQELYLIAGVHSSWLANTDWYTH